MASADLNLAKEPKCPKIKDKTLGVTNSYLGTSVKAARCLESGTPETFMGAVAQSAVGNKSAC